LKLKLRAAGFVPNIKHLTLGPLTPHHLQFLRQCRKAPISIGGLFVASMRDLGEGSGWKGSFLIHFPVFYRTNSKFSHALKPLSIKASMRKRAVFYPLALEKKPFSV
jgi:hypothetical protein